MKLLTALTLFTSVTSCAHAGGIPEPGLSAWTHRIDEGMSAMATFMDVHHGMTGITAEQLAAAHQADLAVEAEENVHFKQAWADPESGTVYCLSEAPSKEAVQRVHERAGNRADEVHSITISI